MMQEEEELCVWGGVCTFPQALLIQQREGSHKKQGGPTGKQLFSAVHSQGIKYPGLCLLRGRAGRLPMQNFLVLCQRVEVYT